MPLHSCLMAAGSVVSRPLTSSRWRTAMRSTPCFTRPEAACRVLRSNCRNLVLRPALS
uniref:Ubiquitin-like protein SMT3 n=1 Tax=Arundo donax TaxID=35708 RepID=A0A0A9AVG5_ARUDO